MLWLRPSQLSTLLLSLIGVGTIGTALVMLACPVLLFIILRFAGSLLAAPTIGEEGEEAPAGHLEPIAEEDGDEDSAESRTVETAVEGKI